MLTRWRQRSGVKLDGWFMNRKSDHGLPELKGALAASRSLFVGVAVFSFFVNLLMLTGPLFMLQVYDRVLASRSEATLLTLFLLITALFALMGVLDFARTRVLSRAGARFQALLDRRVFDAVLRRAISPDERGRPSSGLRDLESIQRALSGPAPFAFFDAPWAPLFLALIFMFHWSLGLLAICGGLVLFAIAILNERRARAPLGASAEASARSGASPRFCAARARPCRAWGCAPPRWTAGRNCATARWAHRSPRPTPRRAMRSPRRRCVSFGNRRCWALARCWPSRAPSPPA